eukprot:COSAG01_NODE_7074_length_3365_cov_4.104409_2_plen_684_part_00
MCVGCQQWGGSCKKDKEYFTDKNGNVVSLGNQKNPNGVDLYVGGYSLWSAQPSQCGSQCGGKGIKIIIETVSCPYLENIDGQFSVGWPDPKCDGTCMREKGLLNLDSLNFPMLKSIGTRTGNRYMNINRAPKLKCVIMGLNELCGWVGSPAKNNCDKTHPNAMWQIWGNGPHTTIYNTGKYNGGIFPPAGQNRKRPTAYSNNGLNEYKVGKCTVNGPPPPGCMDKTAANYNPLSITDVGAPPCRCEAFMNPIPLRKTQGLCTACPGDQNGDKFVSAFDVVLLLGDYGLADCKLISDADGDCKIGAADLLALQKQIGRDCKCGANSVGTRKHALDPCVCKPGYSGADCSISRNILWPARPLVSHRPGQWSRVVSGGLQPWGMTFTRDYKHGLIVDYGGHTIQQIDTTTHKAEIIAGVRGSAGFTDGKLGAGTLKMPRGVTCSLDGSYALVADMGNRAIRKIMLATKAMSTLSGSPGPVRNVDGPVATAKWGEPSGIAFAPTGLYVVVTDSNLNIIRKIDLQTMSVSTIAGIANSQGKLDGTGTKASFLYPMDIQWHPSETYFVIYDYSNRLGGSGIRKFDLKTSVVTTINGPWSTGGNNKPIMSPDGKFLVVIDGQNWKPCVTKWWKYDLATGKAIDVTPSSNAAKTKNFYNGAINPHSKGAYIWATCGDGSYGQCNAVYQLSL